MFSNVQPTIFVAPAVTTLPATLSIAALLLVVPPAAARSTEVLAEVEKVSLVATAAETRVGPASAARRDTVEVATAAAAAAAAEGAR